MRGYTTPTTLEEKAEIVRLYKEGFSTKEIVAAVGKSDQTIYNILDKEGVRKIAYGSKPQSKATKNLICPKCRAKGHIKGSRYCYKCGTDIRSEAVILAEKLQSLLPNVQLLPDNIRTEASDIIQQAVKYLNNQGV